MPAGQPFTRLCQHTARPATSGRADLHLHTTHSDGSYSPAEVVDLARRSGLAAIAITDHDTTAGVAEARAAAPSSLEVITGAEITAEHQGREVHLLGYYFRPDDPALSAALAWLRASRRDRFRGMVERLRGRGVSVEDEAIPDGGDGVALGRRTLALALQRSGRVGSVEEAFARWLRDGGPVDMPKARLPAAEAVALVRGAGGVASLAHPPAGLTLPALVALRDLGLQAIEVECPGHRPARARELRQWAAALRLAVTGGSDCHGPAGPRRTVGACSINATELAALRRLAQE
jgi:predicted metal-dependent phosphoesterase TrpH